MRAMILCAGLGTRLGELSTYRPKPMLPVCGMPILAFGIANLVAHGVVDLVINTHHLGEVIERELGDGARYGACIRYIHEPVILGTGGGLKHALALLDPTGDDEPFLSLNGKLIFDVDLHAVLAAHRKAGDVAGTLVVRRVPDATSWGAVKLTSSASGHRVVDILGEGEHMFCGVHVTRPSVVRRLPDGEACMIRQGYLPWIRAGVQVAAYEHGDGYFAEHSTVERYLESQRALLTESRLRHPPGRLVGVDPTARVHPSAVVHDPVHIGAGAIIGAGATIGPFTSIGAGATVATNVSVAGCAVWPGATAAHSAVGQVIA